MLIFACVNTCVGGLVYFVVLCCLRCGFVFGLLYCCRFVCLLFALGLTVIDLVALIVSFLVSWIFC